MFGQKWPPLLSYHDISISQHNLKCPSSPIIVPAEVHHVQHCLCNPSFYSLWPSQLYELVYAINLSNKKRSLSTYKPLMDGICHQWDETRFVKAAGVITPIIEKDGERYKKLLLCLCIQRSIEKVPSAIHSHAHTQCERYFRCRLWAQFWI